jgi:hypothetical protein
MKTGISELPADNAKASGHLLLLTHNLLYNNRLSRNIHARWRLGVRAGYSLGQDSRPADLGLAVVAAG